MHQVLNKWVKSWGMGDFHASVFSHSRRMEYINEFAFFISANIQVKE
ncbi:hypothetical protein HNQ64_000700 [Prosthecobacter dejongeii]|uniref:Uncharacterized protein n=1 Tax=Prosthecobacter dejongeii TaxID=48465 RepID=A0A7W7YHV0_9BACT|nr:hypothetical protein [Prosthecobacter dejongeii]